MYRAHPFPLICTAETLLQPRVADRSEALLHQPSLVGQNLHHRQGKPRTLGLDHLHLHSRMRGTFHNSWCGMWRRAGPSTHRQCPLVEQDCHSERSEPLAWHQFHDTWNRHSSRERGRLLEQRALLLSLSGE